MYSDLQSAVTHSGSWGAKQHICHGAPPQEIGRGDEAGGAHSGGFSFQQLPPGAEQPWQPAFVPSLDRRGSSTTPTFAAAAPGAAVNEARLGAAGGPAAGASKDSAGDESAATPISEVRVACLSNRCTVC